MPSPLFFLIQERIGACINWNSFYRVLQCEKIDFVQAPQLKNCCVFSCRSCGPHWHCTSSVIKCFKRGFCNCLLLVVPVLEKFDWCKGFKLLQHCTGVKCYVTRKGGKYLVHTGHITLNHDSWTWKTNHSMPLGNDWSGVTLVKEQSQPWQLISQEEDPKYINQ